MSVVFSATCFQKHACSFPLLFIQHIAVSLHNFRPFDLQNSYCPQYNSHDMHTVPPCQGIRIVPGMFLKKIFKEGKACFATKKHHNFMQIWLLDDGGRMFGGGGGLQSIDLKSIDEAATDCGRK